MSTADEMWRNIPGVPGYQASTLGRVRSIDRVVIAIDGRVCPLRGKVLSASPIGKHDGHLKVCVSGKTRTVHTLVLEAFTGPRPPGMEACHENGDPADNRLVNLRWDTRSSNLKDRVRHGSHDRVNRTHCPRNHPLSSPNIQPSRARVGHRVCLACGRARSRRRFMLTKGVDLDLQQLSDAYFAEIMSRSIDDRRSA